MIFPGKEPQHLAHKGKGLVYMKVQFTFMALALQGLMVLQFRFRIAQGVYRMPAPGRGEAELDDSLGELIVGRA